ncbi:hypothetical protein EAO71_12095 [Streptomyces sp. ms191]|uniref:hypothetical protein n=1 Tax=Streptomyces sp. ms191 TaxID=1827978 RepID=UPI0011CE902E|nr:hypothetical protein [Streptomyces sp. ms191]TXS29424.1 hypothetical protein EAO71_12095 [Streptomyces sp. ms191]
MTDAQSPIRVLRAALFAAVCVSLASVGHLFMSAHELAPSALSLAFAVTGGLAWLAGGRRRGTVAIGGGLLAVQAALHLIFSSVRSHDGTHHAGLADTTPGDHALTDAAAPDAASSAAHLAGSVMSHPMAADMEQPLTATAGHTPLGMLAAHLLAALVCGLWLARGEAALFAIARAVGTLAFTPLRLLLAVVRVRVPELPQPVRPRRPHTRRLRGVVLAQARSRRGPPRLSAPRATALGAHV